jgi:glutaredoxin 3
MLLTKKSVRFEDINVAADPALFAEMTEKTQSRSVPQIIVGDTLVGGFDELSALDKSGELDALLKQ